MKRLIVCLDGTWMRADRGIHSTNVVKLMRAIAPRDGENHPQLLHYGKGVGAQGGRAARILAGFTGQGLEENIKDAYIFLANNYEPGDEIFLFGFSRGAYTARSLAGFIGAAGLLDRFSLGRLGPAWKYYRASSRRRARMEHPGGHRVPIQCIGVWDTVGARGIPVRWFRPAHWIRRWRFAFHDTSLGPDVRCALHALAVDEKRAPFAPTLWQRPEDAETPRDQVVEQVWFAGCHSDVGGGIEPKNATSDKDLADHAGLPDLALEWMVERVRLHTGLAFGSDWRRQKRPIQGDPLGHLHESRSLPYAVSWILPYQRVVAGRDAWTRSILPSRNRPKKGNVFIGEAVHESAWVRYGQVPKGARRPYTPRNVAAAREHVATAPWRPPVRLMDAAPADVSPGEEATTPLRSS